MTMAKIKTHIKNVFPPVANLIEQGCQSEREDKLSTMHDLKGFKGKQLDVIFISANYPLTFQDFLIGNSNWMQ